MSTDDQRDDHNDQPRSGGAGHEHGAHDDAPRYGERITPGSAPRADEHQAPQWGGHQDHQQQTPQWGGQPDHQQYGQQQYGQQQQYDQGQYAQHGQAQQWHQGGAPAWQAHEEPRTKKKTVGVIAFVVGLAALVVGIIGGVLLGSEFGASDAFQDAMRQQGGTSSDPSQYQDLMGSSSFLAGVALFYVGTALGLWAVVQGVVAIATRRGRGWGVAAIVLAVVGFIAYLVAIGITAIGAAGGTGGI